MIFRPKITNTNTNPNTITSINIEITNIDFKSTIFPFKITNQTQILDLWFSFFPFRNHKHKYKHKLTWLRQTEPRKKRKRKKMENEVEWGRVTLVAMGEEDERGKGLCDSVRSATARTKWSWESREPMRRLCGVKPVQRRREEDERARGLCLCLTAQSACGLVVVCVVGLWPSVWESWEMKRERRRCELKRGEE